MSEQEARKQIDGLLEQAGWLIQDVAQANIHAGRGVAIREFPLKTGHGFADYLLYVDGRAAGVIEAKKAGTTLTGVETQSDKYTQGLPDGLPAWGFPLPYSYQSTGIETRFTNHLDPEPRSRQVFAFHRPDYFTHDLEAVGTVNQAAEGHPIYLNRNLTFLGRLRTMPPLIKEGLWPAQITAIENLEQSLRENRPRALIQMATGSGKTFTAISFIYRLIKFAGARRVLFLVDRGNLGRQTHKEFQQYVSPYNNYKFTEEFIVQRLASNTLDTTARVCISTIQRLYSMLKGEELPEEEDERSAAGLEQVFREVPPIEYNPKIPIETFDLIITDECHRSIYNLWRQVLEYFDAYLVGLTATPSKQTFGFFRKNLVMEYGHEQAVIDNVNVNYDVYRIETAITGQGSKVEAGFYVDRRDRETRAVRWERLDEELSYQANQLDRDVVAVDQIRTVVRAYRDRLFTEIFPGRTEVPKTLIFAKDDSHAEDIVKIVREEFGKGNEFAQKITYKSTGASPEQLIKDFRTCYHPRIAVTVDMIATGTDIKPLEVVMFMRSVKSRSFFEQMKGRGVRVINDSDLQAVTPDARTKDRFVIVDAVGVCEQDKTDSRPMDQKKAVPFDKLLRAMSLGSLEPEVLSSLAVRFGRLHRQMGEKDRREIAGKAGGKDLRAIANDLVASLNPDKQLARAKKEHGTEAPTPEQVRQTAAKMMQEAVKPLHDPALRNLLVEVKKRNEQIIDHVSQDELLASGFSEAARERAREVVSSFERFIEEHKDEITALQILYSQPYRARLRFEDIKELAEAIRKPPHHLSEDKLWQAYAALEKSKVRNATGRHLLTDLVSLVRFAVHREEELVPFPEKVEANFAAWLADQEAGGTEFTPEQRRWLAMIRDHIAANLAIETGDFDFAPFAQEGGIGKVWQLFGEGLDRILEELNEKLAA